MQALLLTEYRKLELTSVEEPTLGPHDVLVAVRACGICGSDVHGYDGSSGRRIPPIVMGHEAAGVVARVGSDVERVEIGDAVTFDSTLFCGECAACRQGNVNLCTKRRVLGVSCDEYRQHGAFADFVAVPEHVVCRLPEGMPFEHAAMAEPVAVALHAVARVPIRSGDRAAVIGTGMIGLLVVQALRLAGCTDVIAVDLDDARLRLAAELGATSTVNSAQVDAAATIMKRTGGQGLDVAMEVVGHASALATAVNCVRRGGHVGLIGNLAPSVSLALQTVVTRELSLFGSCASAGEYPRAIELVACGAIRVDSLISAIAPLAEGPRWFERLYAREPNLMKIMLCPNGSGGKV
jgi:L-iditol 2-dehydrogenase